MVSIVISVAFASSLSRKRKTLCLWPAKAWTIVSNIAIMVGLEPELYVAQTKFGGIEALTRSLTVYWIRLYSFSYVKSSGEG